MVYNIKFLCATEEVCGSVCVCRDTPHLTAVEHPDLVQSLFGRHPQAVVSTEVTSLAAPWLSVTS